MHKESKTANKLGFTLVELSIVIIIIGFLIAGVAAGNSLIKQAKLGSVISDMQSYQAAYNAFKVRYNALPGDMRLAGTYFPSCGWCNGNGNSLIEFDSSVVNGPWVNDESGAAWRLLSLAGLITLQTPYISQGNIGVYVVGTNIPESKVTGAGYLMSGAGYKIGAIVDSPWTGGITNSVFIGKPNTIGLDNSALKPEDAYNLDKKIDNGDTDSSGNLTGAITGIFRSTDGADQAGNCTNGTNNYLLSNDIISCVSGMAIN